MNRCTIQFLIVLLIFLGQKLSAQNRQRAIHGYRIIKNNSVGQIWELNIYANGNLNTDYLGDVPVIVRQGATGAVVDRPNDIYTVGEKADHVNDGENGTRFLSGGSGTFSTVDIIRKQPLSSNNGIYIVELNVEGFRAERSNGLSFALLDNLGNSIAASETMQISGLVHKEAKRIFMIFSAVTGSVFLQPTFNPGFFIFSPLSLISPLSSVFTLSTFPHQVSQRVVNIFSISDRSVKTFEDGTRNKDVSTASGLVIGTLRIVGNDVNFYPDANNKGSANNFEIKITGSIQPSFFVNFRNSSDTKINFTYDRSFLTEGESDTTIEGNYRIINGSDGSTDRIINIQGRTNSVIVGTYGTLRTTLQRTNANYIYTLSSTEEQRKNVLRLRRGERVTDEFIFKSNEGEESTLIINIRGTDLEVSDFMFLDGNLGIIRNSENQAFISINENSSGILANISDVIGLDSQDRATYSLSGEVKGFTIDSNTGVIRTTGFDFEKVNSLSLVVNISNGRAVYSETINIRIIDVNEAPTEVKLSESSKVFSSSMETTSRRELADIIIEDDTSVENMNEIILSGEDAAKFEIFDEKLYLRAGINLEIGELEVTVNIADSTSTSLIAVKENFTLRVARAGLFFSHKNGLIEEKTETISGFYAYVDQLDGTKDSLASIGGEVAISDETLNFRGIYGNLALTGTNYIYTLDNTDVDTLGLKKDQTVTETFIFTSVAGVESNLDIVITGVNTTPTDLTFSVGDFGDIRKRNGRSYLRITENIPGIVAIVSATDVDGNDEGSQEISYSFLEEVEGFTINSNTGVIRTTGINFDEVNSFSLVVNVNDGTNDFSQSLGVFGENIADEIKISRTETNPSLGKILNQIITIIDENMELTEVDSEFFERLKTLTSEKKISLISQLLPIAQSNVVSVVEDVVNDIAVGLALRNLNYSGLLIPNGPQVAELDAFKFFTESGISDINFWYDFNYTSGNREGGSSSSGYNFTGISYRFGLEKLYANTFIGGSFSVGETEVDNRGSGKSDFNTLTLGSYGNYRRENYFITANLLFAFTNFKGNRSSIGTFSGDILNFSFSANYGLIRSRKENNVTYIAGFRYTNTGTKKMNDLGILAGSVKSKNNNSLYFELGIINSYNFTKKVNSSQSISVQVNYNYNLLDVERSISSRFSAGGNGFETQGVNQDRGIIIFGMAWKYKFKRINYELGYNYRFSSNSEINNLGLKIKYNF